MLPPFVSSGRGRKAHAVSIGPAPLTPEPCDDVEFIQYVERIFEWRKKHLNLGNAVCEANYFMRSMYRDARKLDFVFGKWMFVCRREVASALWEDVQKANKRGKLGGYCEAYKPNPMVKTVYFAAYCADFDDTRDCRRVLIALLNICKPYEARVIAFEPEFLTAVGVGCGRYTFEEVGIQDDWQHPVVFELQEEFCGTPLVWHGCGQYTADEPDKQNEEQKVVLCDLQEEVSKTTHVSRGCAQKNCGESDSEDDQKKPVPCDMQEDVSETTPVSHGCGQKNCDESDSEEDQQKPVLCHLQEDASKSPPVWTKRHDKNRHVVSHGSPRLTPVLCDDVACTENLDGYFGWRKKQIELGNPVSTGADFMQKMHEIATSFKFVVGKWILFPKSPIACHLWKDIHNANKRGELGGYCEVYKVDENTCTRYMAVYCSDFNNTDDCRRILSALHNICKPYGARVIAFKPEFLTSLGVGSDRYTYDELNIAEEWQYPALRKIRDEVCGSRSGTISRSRSRRRRRQLKKAKSRENIAGPPYPNPYQNDEQHVPSRPNGAWTEKERKATFIFHVNRARAAANPTIDEDELFKKARALLDEYKRKYEDDDEAVTEDEKREVMRRVWDLAAEHRYVVGKWKVFLPPKVADELWKAICDGIDDGRLEDTAKISRYNETSGKFLVCVYCNDFSDTARCRKLLFNLAKICAPFGVPIGANFKCDFLTSLGVYGGEEVHNSAVRVKYALNRLGLRDYWMNETLKGLLDELRETMY